MYDPDATSDPTLFPSENPNPVFRVAADGLILFANRACDGLLASWGTSRSGRLPAEWQQHIGEALSTGVSRRVPARCCDRVFELDLVPILDRNYVNAYGRDVTAQEAVRLEREALLTELGQDKSRLATLAGELKRERDLQQTLMENTQASLVYLDPQFNLIRMNAAYEAACQRPRAEMLGRNHSNCSPMPRTKRYLPTCGTPANGLRSSPGPLCSPTNPGAA